MLEPIKAVNKNLTYFSSSKRVFRALQRHLNAQPVGFPRTPSGVDLRVLSHMFTIDEARAAVYLTYKHEPLQVIFNRVPHDMFSSEKLNILLDNLDRKGSIFVKVEHGEKLYALHPFVMGMHELQVLRKKSPAYYLDMRRYMLEGFISEYFATKIPQMRSIPIEKSVTPDLNIATYDEVRSIIDRAGDRIALAPCDCKLGKDQIGDPCKVTQRREICLNLSDLNDTVIRNGWGRSISKEEAMDMLAQNEEEGLVLLTSSNQDPYYVCACCGCCCGVLELLNVVPRPADFAAANYQAVLNPSSCKGCGTCVKRCQMDAVIYDTKAVKAKKINTKRCIGCGLCVATCPTNSIQLKKKDDIVPPQDIEAMFELFKEHKKGRMAKIFHLAMNCLK